MQSMCPRRNLTLLLILALFALAAAALRVAASSCSLADHIRSANTNTSIGGCPQGTSHDMITLTEDITLREALPPITGTITIEGNGHTISGDGEHRVFDVVGGQLTLINLTLTDGKAPEAEDGGAIRARNGALVSARQVAFRDSAAYQGGAIAAKGAGVRLDIRSSSFIRNNSDAYGGAIFGYGSRVEIISSSFLRNIAGYDGGALAAHEETRMSISNSTFANNSANAGGALEVFASQASLTHVTMMNNSAKSSRGRRDSSHGRRDSPVQQHRWRRRGRQRLPQRIDRSERQSKPGRNLQLDGNAERPAGRRS